MATEYALKKTESREVCFTGFEVPVRAELEHLAEVAGWRIRKSVVLSLTLLVAGPNAGPSKLATAKGFGKEIIDEAAFRERLKSSAPPSLPAS